MNADFYKTKNLSRKLSARKGSRKLSKSTSDLVKDQADEGGEGKGNTDSNRPSQKLDEVKKIDEEINGESPPAHDDDDTGHVDGKSAVLDMATFPAGSQMSLNARASLLLRW